MTIDVNSPKAHNLELQLREIICQLTSLPAEFDPAAHLYLDLGVASLYALQLLTEIEERFGIHVPDEEFVEATSLAKMTDLVQRLAGEALKK